VFEARKGISERLYLPVALTEEMQHKPQGCSTPYSRQRCHLIDCLF